jgi:hypothetical protein
MSSFGRRLEELPTFLATIAMVSDDGSQLVNGLRRAERRSPAIYTPTRQLFLRILDGSLSYAGGMGQAHQLADSRERGCAVAVLRQSKRFLETQPKSRIVLLATMTLVLPSGLNLSVGPIWVRHMNFETRLLVLHFWQIALSDRQLSAAAAILRATILMNHVGLASSEIDFISVSNSEMSETRRFQNLQWRQLDPLNEGELTKFAHQIEAGWNAYLHSAPRESNRRNSLPDLFGSH